jgi:hypothetical protein
MLYWYEIEVIVVFEGPVAGLMKRDNDGHHFTDIERAFPPPFWCAI